MRERQASEELKEVLDAAIAAGLSGIWACGNSQLGMSISQSLSRTLSSMAAYIGGIRGAYRDELPPSEAILCAVHPQAVSGSLVTYANVAVLLRPLVYRRLMRIVGMWADVNVGRDVAHKLVISVRILPRTLVVMSDSASPIVAWPHNVNVGCLQALGEEMDLWTRP